MAPSPSFASTAAATGEADAPKERRDPPSCPTCAQPSRGTPDLYGVYRCGRCEIEFRPPQRVPIRRAGVSATASAGASSGWIGLLAVGALIIGVAIAAGDSQAPHDPPPFMIDGSQLGPPPSLDLALLDDMEDLDLLGARIVTLEHEVHVSQISQGDLSLTGLVRNPSRHAVDSVDVQVRCLDSTGAQIESRAATSACQRMGPQEVCAWSLDARVPGIAGFELEALAGRSFVDMPSLELRGRFDADGQRLAGQEREDTLELDLERRRVSFELGGELTALAAQATIVSFDGEGRVRAVQQTRWPGMVAGGRPHSRPISIDAPEGTAEYELRVSSSLVVDSAALELAPAVPDARAR